MILISASHEHTVVLPKMTSAPTIIRRDNCDYLTNGSPTNIDNFMKERCAFFICYVGIKPGVYLKWCVLTFGVPSCKHGLTTFLGRMLENLSGSSGMAPGMGAKSWERRSSASRRSRRKPRRNLHGEFQVHTSAVPEEMQAQDRPSRLTRALVLCHQRQEGWGIFWMVSNPSICFLSELHET
jgi:hypothetical protein